MLLSDEKIFLTVQLLYCVKYSHCNVIDIQRFNPLKRDKIVADVSEANIYQSLNKLAFYYAQLENKATVDFAFGLRAAEGEIAHVLHLTDVDDPSIVATQRVFRKMLKDLQDSIENSVDQSLPFIKENNPKYFHQFYPLISKAWNSYRLPPQITARNDISVFPNITNDDEDSELSEEESDLCMARLMGTEGNMPCSVEKCWKAMTKMGTYSYYATHQLLWLVLGAKVGCRKAMDERAVQEGYKNGIDDIINKKCAGVVIEMEAIMEDGVRRSFRDLFLEQGFVCGSIGFMDAVRPEWLKQVFSWQDPNLGCFPDFESDDVDDMKEFQFWINYKREQWKARNLLFEVTNEDGCSTHFSGVAAGFLATHLRLFFDPLYQKKMLQPFIGVEISSRSDSRTDLRILLIFVLFIAVLLASRKRKHFFGITVKFRQLLRWIWRTCYKSTDSFRRIV